MFLIEFIILCLVSLSICSFSTCRLKNLTFCNDVVLLMTETTGSLCTINFLLEFYELNESSKGKLSFNFHVLFCIV
jgi:hypothetical protein